MERIKIIRLPETDSTNRFLHEYRGEEGERMTVVVSLYQTAGRGQGSNSWESERGKNLTFSVKARPQGVPVMRQFVLLEACSLAVRDAYTRYADGFSVKWPNDIYWHDRKISGTLSECSVDSHGVKDCVWGIGMNINQQAFTSGAPNPVSLYNIIGGETPCEELLQTVLQRLDHYLSIVDKGDYAEIDRQYLEHLYRRGQWHTYTDKDGTFEGRILGINELGHLQMEDRQGKVRNYAFKKVKFASV